MRLLLSGKTIRPRQLRPDFFSEKHGRHCSINVR